MPVFNEERSVVSVLDEWTAELGRSGADYTILVIDDGSTDASPEVLHNWKSDHPSVHLEVMRHANRGHGQTCLEGYRIACDRRIPWVFQIDSYGQCDPTFFSDVWAARHGDDVVYGRRAKRKDGLKRVLASVLVKAVVRAASGAVCIDANVPYRLMRTEKLHSLVDSIPSDFDLANIALAVQIQRAAWPECSVPIVFRARTGGEPSVPLLRFASKAIELAAELRHLGQP
jgi:dolichol-phosphate mannosyltransferase